MLILTHLFDWSYDDLEHEVRAHLLYRAFTRIDAGDVPDAKTILTIARVVGPEVIEELQRRVVDVAKRAGVTHGRRFRIDAADSGGASGAKARISVIKRRRGLRRCRDHGADGTARWVGLGVIGTNLVSTARFLNARATT